MSQENTPRANWIKPVVIGVLVAALAVGGYLSMIYRPSVADVTFISLAGEKVSTPSLRGKVVIINFWTTDCATCIKEMPQMITTYNKFKGQGLEFVAVALQRDRPDYVVNFTETYKLPFIVALDSGGDIAKAFGDVQLTPTTYVVGKDGKVLKIYVGEPNFPALHALLQQALAS
jgi:peroxiredoxin